jgi:transcription initiation factor TFIIIB Brf1 subunit/transcription initiation factor TFIIB
MNSKTKKESLPEECHDCGSTDLEYRRERQEAVCRECGLIMSIDEEDDTEESNSSDSTFNSNLLISKFISESDVNLNSREFRSKKRHLLRASQQLSDLSKKHKLSRESYNNACAFYTSYFIQSSSVKSIKKMAVACIHLGAKKSKKPLIKDELSKKSDISIREINKYERKLIRELNIAPIVLEPQDYLDAVNKNLELNEENIQKARDIIDVSRPFWKSSGKSPISIACAAIYLAVKSTPEAITQEKAADAGYLAELTIRRAYQEMKDYVGQDQKEIESFHRF